MTFSLIFSDILWRKILDSWSCVFSVAASTLGQWHPGAAPLDRYCSALTFNGPRRPTDVHGGPRRINHGELVLLLCNGKKNQIRRPQQWAGGAHQRKSVVLGAGTWLLHGILLWPAKPSVTGLLVPVPLVKVTLNLFGMLVPLPLPVQKVTLETAVCGLLGPVKPSAGCCFPVSEHFRRSTTRLRKTFTDLPVPIPLALFGVLVPLPLPF